MLVIHKIYFLLNLLLNNNNNNSKLQRAGLRRRLSKEAVYGSCFTVTIKICWCVAVLDIWRGDGAAVPVVVEE